MFGIISGGRPLDTNVKQVDVNKYVAVIVNAAKLNHMAVFLLPGAELPPDVAASVYIQLPGQEFTLLGALTLAKQSAIFKFNAALVSLGLSDVDVMMEDDDGSKEYDINVGISIEPIAQVEQQLAALKANQQQKNKTIMPAQQQPPAPTQAGDIAELANKIVAHAYNYMSSFVDAQAKVPIKAFDDWWAKFKSKLNANPNFLNEIAQ